MGKYYKSDILKNKSYWENMSPNELEYFKSQIFYYYRFAGFPFYPTDKEYRDREFEKLINYDHSNVIVGDTIKQTMHGLALAWSYFPHAYDVKCNNKLTPYEVFKDDEKFMKVIEKRLKMGTYISDSGILKMLKMFSNTQGVSNFRPTAAAAIYDKFAPNGIVWDMSGGWGGRMLGAIKSSVKQYIATEPSKKTFQGLFDLGHNYCGDTNIRLSMQGSEDYIPEKNSLDLCFTSPPYFDLEKYSNDRSQSYIKYPDINSWINEFLGKTMENCFYGLKSNKYMLINIADHKKSKISLEKATVEKAKQSGFHYEGRLKLALSNPNMKNRKSPFKYEPIFIFKKK